MFPILVLFIHELSIKLKKEQLFTFSRKRIIIAISLSLMLGVIMGVFMLMMFPNINSEPPKQIAINNNDSEKEENVQDLINDEAESISAYVLQGGMFSNIENVEKWLNTFKENKAHPFVWEKDGDYFLFVGLSNNEEQAKSKTKTAGLDSFDIFVKEWKVESVAITALQEEIDWLESFREYWDLTIEDYTYLTEWGTLLETAKEYPIIGPYSALMNEKLEAIHTEHEFEVDYFLLYVWEQYERLLNDLKDGNNNLKE